MDPCKVLHNLLDLVYPFLAKNSFFLRIGSTKMLAFASIFNACFILLTAMFEPREWWSLKTGVDSNQTFLIQMENWGN